MRHCLNSILLGSGLILGTATAADIENRIIGGCDSEDTGHDWMVAVARTDYGSQWNSQFCGATLIHENWAITAAHCMFYGDNNTAYTPDQLELYIGTTLLDSGEGQTHEVSEIHVHPSYTELTSTSYNDIALLKLSTPSTQSTARLATIKPGADYDALVLGWGRRSTDGATSVDYPQALQEVNVTTFDNANCYSSVIDSHLCAGELSGGEDSCSGDSGGPLLLSSRGSDTLVGIVSYGYGCAQPNNVGVYTSVASFHSWIAATTLDATTNISDVPLPTVYSESFGDFTSNCESKDNNSSNTEQPTVFSSSGGGSVGFLFFIATLFGLSRYPTQRSKA